VVPGVGVGWFVLVGVADGLSVVDVEGEWDGLAVAVADGEVDDEGAGVGLLLFELKLNPPVAM
jgi:hypothetical protein